MGDDELAEISLEVLTAATGEKREKPAGHMHRRGGSAGSSLGRKARAVWRAVAGLLPCDAKNSPAALAGGPDCVGWCRLDSPGRQFKLMQGIEEVQRQRERSFKLERDATGLLW